MPTSNLDLEQRSLDFLRDLKRLPGDYFVEAAVGFYGLEVFCLEPQVEGPIIDIVCQRGARLTIVPIYHYEVLQSDEIDFDLILERIVEAAQASNQTGELRGIVLPGLSVIVDPTRGRYDTCRITLRSLSAEFALADLAELATRLLQLFDDDNPGFWDSAVVSIARGSYWIYSMHDEPLQRVESKFVDAEAGR